LRPEEHVQEVPLSEKLGVSRTPIREALVALGQEQLLVYRPNRGYIVRGFTLEEIINAHIVRGALEGLACRLLAEAGIDDPTRRTLEQCLIDGDRILAVGALTEEGLTPYRVMNHTFHQTIIKATNNAYLHDVTERTLAIPLVSTRVIHWFDFDRNHFAHQLHHGIFEAICKRQSGRAEALMREHIERGTEIIREHYEPLVADRGAPLQHFAAVNTPII